MAERDDGDLSVAELLDKASRRVTTAVLMAGALIAISIYAKPGPPRYDVAAADGRVVRVDTRSGAMISCGGDGCATLHKPGGKIEITIDGDKAPALPAPASTPTLAPAPQPAPAPATR
jgi:hypothetical protein